MRRTGRGSVIVAVLLLVAIGVTIAASVLVSAEAAAEASRAEMSRTQSRALAWSGVQAVMAELATLREDILDGQAPEPTAAWDLFTLEDGTRGVVRLMDLTPEAPGPLAAENGKLDLNTATEEMLSGVPGLSPALAARIVSARAAGPFASVEQLLSVEGIGPRLLYGSDREEPAPLPAPMAISGVEPPSEGLTAYLTVFSFDPNVQVGLDGDEDARGALRVHLGHAWSDELGLAIADRLGDQTAQFIGKLMRSERVLETDADFVQAMLDAGILPEEWGTLLDVFTTRADPYQTGRVDLNTASAEVLACIPGISGEQAARIVAARESLDGMSRRSLAWPVVEGILPAEEFGRVVDLVTTRSTQWRARIEVGFEADRDGVWELAGLAGEGDAGIGGSDAERPPKPEHGMVFDAVIDIASTRPRVAYLRDVTALEPVLALLPSRTDETPEAMEDRIPAPVEENAEAESEGFSLDGTGDLDLSPEPVAGAEPPESERPDAGAATEAVGERAGHTDPGDRRIGRWSTRRASTS